MRKRVGELYNVEIFDVIEDDKIVGRILKVNDNEEEFKDISVADLRLKELVEAEKERVNDFKMLYGREPHRGETSETKQKEYEKKRGEKQ